MASRVDVQYVNFYTEGSAAKKIAAPLPRKQVQRKPAAVKKVKRKAIHIDPVAVLSLAVCAALVITLGFGIAKVQSATEQTQRMQQYVEQLTRENEALMREYEENFDPQQIEKTALALGMVHSDQASHRGVGAQMSQQTQAQSQSLFWQNFVAFFANIFA